MAPSGGSVATWTVVFTDLVGSTEHRVRVGEVRFDTVRADLDRRLAPLLEEHGAVVVKSTGDGLMLGFAATAAALQCAVAIQRAVADRNEEGLEAIDLRVGISVGDAMREDGDLHGTAVVEAARLCSIAEAGSILCSGAVRTVSANRSGCSFGEGRTVELKGLPGPVVVHEVAWRGPSSAAAGELTFGVLGPFSVERGGRPVALGGPKERLVLAVLVSHANRVVPVEALMDAVWGEHPPRTAERTLHAYVARIRKALEPDRTSGDAQGVLQTVGRGYRLRVEPGQVDASRFEQAARAGAEALRDGRPAGSTLADALAEWRGAAYGEFPEVEACAVEASRLEELRLLALEHRIDADLAAGNDLELVAEIEASLREHPFRERLWGQLVLALYRAGRQRDALDAYQRARAVLVEELGIEPGPELRRLEAAVLAQDPSLDRATRVPAVGPAGFPLLLDAVGPAFVGRDREADWLRAAWAEATEGRGSFVSVLGPEGIGKTRLIAEVAREAHEAGAAVLYGRCDHAHLGARSLVDLALRSGGGSVGDLDGDGGTGGLAAALGRHLPTWAGGRPVLLVFDDLHLADGETLEFVADLAGWCRATPLLVVGTFRSDPGGGSDGSSQLELGPLSTDEVAGICRLYEPEGWTVDEVRQITELTGGVPLAIHERASAWARDRTSRRVERAAEQLAASRGRLDVSRDELAAGVEGIQRLLEQRRLQLAGREAQLRADRLAMAACPYKGLARFEQGDAANFFGRERLVAELVARLAEVSFLAVVGPSGSGKSSLVRAGLLPALAAGVLADGEAWDVVAFCPGRHPCDELAWRLPDRGGGAAPLALFVDQFEEVFTACPDEDERRRFVATLVDLTSRPRTAVILAVRADHLGRCAAYPELAGLLAGNDVLVGPMRDPELRRAVELPAQRAGLSIEAGLVDLIISDVAGRAGCLPLLSTALAETWERREQRSLTVAGYRAAGGVNGALARLAEDAYAAIPEPARPAARRFLLRLCDPGESGSIDVRRRLPIDEVVDPADGDARVALDVLADTRLLTIDDDAVEIAHEALLREWPRLRTWLEDDVQGRQLHRRLAAAAHAWDDTGRDPSELYRGSRLGAATEWATIDPAALNALERDFLESSQEAEAWERIRVAAQAAERERTNTRLRRALAGMAVLLVAALVAGVVALDQRRRADDEAATAAARAAEAELRGLLGEAGQLRTTRRDVALLLAVEAHRLAPSPETRSALLAALQAEPAFLGYLRGDDVLTFTTMTFIDDDHVVVGDADGGLTVFEVGTNRQVGRRVPLTEGHPVLALAAEPGRWLAVAQSAESPGPPPTSELAIGGRVLILPADSLLAAAGGQPLITEEIRLDGAAVVHQLAAGTSGELAVGTSEGTVLVASPEQGDEQQVFRVGDGAVAVAFASDGALATGTSDRIRLWRGPDWALATELTSDALVEGSLAFSADGRYLVASQGEYGFRDQVGRDRVYSNIQSWDVSTGQPWGPPADVLCSAVTVVGEQAVCAHSTGRALSFALATGTPTDSLADLHVEGMGGVATSPDGSMLGAIGVRTPVGGLWGIAGASQVAPVVGGPGWYPVWYSRDGAELMVEAGEDGPGFPVGPRHLWDRESHQLVHELDVFAAVPGLDGRVVALLAGARPVVLDPDTGEEIALDPPRNLFITVTAIDVTRRRLAVGFDDGHVEQRDLDTGAAVGTDIDLGGDLSIDPQEELRVERVAYLSGGTALAVAVGDLTHFFDADTGEEILEPVSGSSVVASADGMLLVTASSDGELTVRDPGTGAPIGPTMQTARVRNNNLMVSDDHRLLLVSSWDGTVRLYDLESRTQLGVALRAELTEAGGSHIGAALAADGGQFAVAVPNGVQLWDLDPEDWEATACRLAGRSLTTEEWERYLPADLPYAPACG